MPSTATILPKTSLWLQSRARTPSLRYPSSGERPACGLQWNDVPGDTFLDRSCPDIRNHNYSPV